MRHLVQMTKRPFMRHASYAAGLFQYKVIPSEMFPYPTHKLDSEEADNMQSLIEQIRKDDKELNIYGARIAAEYGGLGLGHTAHALLCEEVGTSGDKNKLLSIQHSGLASFLISTCGSKEVKGKYLTAMSDGTFKMGWAVQEEFGSDISMNKCVAQPESDGTYTISGTKTCFAANTATHFLVLAKTKTQAPSESGPTEVLRNTFFIVEKSAPGIKVETDIVVFDKTPAVDIVGVVGEGFKDRMITVFTEQYVYAAALLGTMKRVVQELQDSVPDKWAVSIISSSACCVYAMESALYALVANMDLPTEDSLLEAALVCAFIEKSSNEWLTVLSTATPSTPELEACFECARQLLSMMESVDFLYSTVVCCGVEECGLLFQRSSTLQMLQARTARSLGMKDRVPVQDIDCTALDSAIVSFGTAAERTFVRSASHLPYKQLIINRLGESAALLYAASASVSRASMCAKKKMPTAKTEKQLAQAFMTTAAARVNLLSHECCNLGLTADDSYQRIALELCEDALK